MFARQPDHPPRSRIYLTQRVLCLSLGCLGSALQKLGWLGLGSGISGKLYGSPGIPWTFWLPANPSD